MQAFGHTHKCSHTSAHALTHKPQNHTDEQTCEKTTLVKIHLFLFAKVMMAATANIKVNIYFYKINIHVFNHIPNSFYRI